MLRTAAALVMSAALLLTAAGCGGNANDDKETNVAKVSGNCALDRDAHQLSPISAELLERTLGDGEYRLSGDVSGSGTDEDPMNGRCTYDSIDDQGKVTNRLELSVNSKNQPGSDYAKQVEKLQSGEGITKLSGVQGYVEVEKEAAYGGGTGESGAGVIIDGDLVFGATILVPAEGVDGKKACEELVKAAAATLGKPLSTK